MKKAIYILFICSTIAFVSCTPDKKDDPLAPSPSVDDRDKFVGSWMCNENSQVSGATSYTISVSKSTSNANEIAINKFYNLITQPRATVSGNNITIPYQSLASLGFASGTGTLSSTGTSLSMRYIVKIGSNDNDTCTATCTKL